MIMMLVLVACLITQAKQESEPPRAATLEKEQIILGIQDRVSLMTSMRMRYVSEVVFPQRAVEPARAERGVAVHIPRQDVTVVRSDRKLLVDVTWPPEHGGRRIWSTTPTATRSFHVASGVVYLETKLDERVYRYDAVSGLMQIPASERHRGITDFKSYQAAGLDGSEGLLPWTMLDERYIVLPDQEKIDNAWCHVVLSNVNQRLAHKYWVDPNCDFAVRRIELLTGPYVLSRANFQNWEKAGKTWFPRKITSEQFRIETKAGSHTVVHTDTIRYTIENIVIGENIQDEAEIRLVPGMVVVDMATQKITTIPGTPDPDFVKAVKDARARERPDKQPGDSSKQRAGR
jgi:hypothetical protein